MSTTETNTQSVKMAMEELWKGGRWKWYCYVQKVLHLFTHFS